MSRPSVQLRDAALGYASRGIPVLPLHHPLPNRGRLQTVTDGGGDHPAWRPAARVGIQAEAPGFLEAPTRERLEP